MKIFHRQSVISIGVLSLVTVFSVLLLTSFGVLIFSSAMSDSELSQLTANSLTEYYNADEKAEERYQTLASIAKSISYGSLPGALEAEGYDVLEGYKYDGIVASYYVFINAEELLHVQIGISPSGSVERLTWSTTANNID